MKYLPPAKNSRWFRVMAAYGLILWLLLGLHRIVLLGQTADAGLLLRFALFAVVVSGIVNGLGWLGARLLWLFTTAGIIFGLVLMYLSSYRDMSGWEDLAGFMTFMVFMLGGFTVGLVTEAIYRALRRKRS
jgi:hypothetical protein